MKNTLLLILLSTVSLSGCALIFEGDTEELMITSDPSGATLYVNGRAHGTTPTSVVLKTEKMHDLKVAYEGHYPEHVHVYTVIDWLYYLDYLFPPAMLVDMLTGAWQDFERSAYHFTLTPTE